MVGRLRTIETMTSPDQVLRKLEDANNQVTMAMDQQTKDIVSPVAGQSAPVKLGDVRDSNSDRPMSAAQAHVARVLGNELGRQAFERLPNKSLPGDFRRNIFGNQFNKIF